MKYKLSDLQKKIIAILELIIYFLPVVHYNFSYESYNEATGEYGTDHVSGFCTMFEWVSGSHVFLALLIVGVLLSVLAVLLNFFKSRFTVKYPNAGNVAIWAAGIYFIVVYFAIVILCARTA